MRRRTGWIAAGAALAVVLGAGAAWLLIPRSGSAEDQALAYLHALQDGDLAAVKATGLEVSADTAAAFEGASAYISEVLVDASAESDSSTVVRASFTLAGEHVKTEITMIERGGRWVPDPATALGTTQIDAPAGVGDAVFAADAAVSLLPAQYEAIASPVEFLEGSATIPMTPGGTQDVALEVTLRPEATERAQKQLAQYLETCTQPASEVPVSCGLAIPWAADFSEVSGITYRIEQAPIISLTPTSFQAGEGVLVATVTGTDIGGDAGQSVSYRTSNWALRGDVAFTADDIVLSVW